MENAKRRCYYEILGVDQKDDLKNIRKVYRKLALRTHPDKAPIGQEEEFKRKFQQLNEAFEVISDPNERAWYDAHREQILSGRSKEEFKGSYGFDFDIDEAMADARKEKETDKLYKKLGEVFMNIKIGEERAREMRDQEDWGVDYMKMPNFGDENATEEELECFYTEWESFTSCRTFAFADEFNPNEYEGRRLKRLIEKENKKFRNAARKTYTDKIKEIVRTAKTLDERWSNLKAKQRKLKEQQEQAEALAQKQKHAAYLKRREELLAQEQKQYEEDRKARGLEDSEEETDIGWVEANQLPYCGICDKEFKSDGAFQHHIKTKQHLKKKKKLMEIVCLDGEEGEIGKVEAELEEVERKEVEEIGKREEGVGKKSKKQKKRERQRKKEEERRLKEKEEEERREREMKDELERIEREKRKFLQEEDEGFGKKKKRRKKGRAKKKNDAFENQQKNSDTLQPKKEEKKEDVKLTKKQKRKLKKKEKEEREKTTCRICRHYFKTRNELFEHLKKQHGY